MLLSLKSLEMVVRILANSQKDFSYFYEYAIKIAQVLIDGHLVVPPVGYMPHALDMKRVSKPLEFERFVVDAFSFQKEYHLIEQQYGEQSAQSEFQELLSLERLNCYDDPLSSTYHLHKLRPDSMDNMTRQEAKSVARRVEMLFVAA